MLLKVIYTDKTIGIVDAARLEELMAKGTLGAFLRLDGWVIVGKDPIRRGGKMFHGADRRRQTCEGAGAFA